MTVWLRPTEKANNDNCPDTSKSKQLVKKQIPWETSQHSILCKEAQHGAIQLYNFLLLCHFFMPLILVLLAFKKQYLAFWINMSLKYKNVVSRQSFIEKYLW